MYVYNFDNFGMNNFLHKVDPFENIHNSFSYIQILSIYNLYFNENFAYFALAVNSCIRCISNQHHKVVHVNSNHNISHCILILRIDI